jgi:exodeoxyribonuclease III
MRILTWNVNGLRAVLNKGAAAWLRTLAPDVICLQEIKVQPHQLKNEHIQELDGYHIAWNPAQKPGYSGVAIMLRQQSWNGGPLPTTETGIGFEAFDVEGRVIRTRLPGFWLYNIYFPSGQRGHDRVEYKLDFYRCLLEICDRHHAQGERIVICGDFNTAHREIDLRNPKSNRNTSGFLPEERAWIDRYLEHGFVDAFRELYPQRVQYTWWTYLSNARQRNVGWRLDYFLVSKGLMPSVRDIEVHQEILGSDHCPVSLMIN